jgi:hypothetical protein
MKYILSNIEKVVVYILKLLEEGEVFVDIKIMQIGEMKEQPKKLDVAMGKLVGIDYKIELVGPDFEEL